MVKVGVVADCRNIAEERMDVDMDVYQQGTEQYQEKDLSKVLFAFNRSTGLPPCGQFILIREREMSAAVSLLPFPNWHLQQLGSHGNQIPKQKKPTRLTQTHTMH